MLKEPRRERLNGKERTYRCRLCGNKYGVFTVNPLPEKDRICAICRRRDHIIQRYKEADGDDVK